MCGIAGIVLREGLIEQRELEPMARSLAHRGPDDRGFYRHGSAGLVHTRLSIIDLSGGHQPLCSPEGDLALVANGEIYNFLELREALEGQGRSFSTRSDSETILHAYAAYGDDFLRHLHGMFAFGLYDRPRRKLLLARDRLGIKPLFYAVLPDRVIFASELKAILSALPRQPEIDPEGLVQFLQSQFSTGERTIFKGIRRLPPASVLSVDADLNVNVRTYWSALDVRTRQVSFEEAEHEFDSLMETVMREHLRSDVPYGLFLSGGVDSAVLLALMSRYQDQPVRTYSIGYAAGMKGELDEAGFIADRFGAAHTPIRLTQKEVFQRLPFSIWASDDLMRDYACLPTSILAEHAARELKVVFSGEGGDEAFAGYRRYRPNFLERTVKGILAPGSGGFRTRGQLQGKWANRLFSPALKRAEASVRQPFVAAWKSAPSSWSVIQKSQYTDLVTALPDNLLVKADRMLMSFGVEGRVPLLDHRVVEFGLSLPDSLKIQSRQGKVFLKRWAEKYIPADYLYRQKRGFHVPVGEWLQGEFVEELAGKLENSRAVGEWFDTRGVRDLFAAKRRGAKVDREIWCLMQFAVWHRLFVDPPAATPTPDENPLDWMD